MVDYTYRIFYQFVSLHLLSLVFQLDTTQAEQISVEHVAKATPTDGTSSSEWHLLPFWVESIQEY